MKVAQKGFGAVNVLLILVTVGLVGFAGWYVWQNQGSEPMPQSDSVQQNTKSNDSTESTPKDEEPLSLDSSKLPTGWAIETEESGRISLGNEDTRCFVGVSYTTDTAESNSPDVDHNQQTVDTIRSKGYSVQETRDTLTITTSKGEKQLEAQSLQLTGLDNPMSQKYAYIAKSDSYTTIQLSCPSSTELPTAQVALSAITFSKVD